MSTLAGAKNAAGCHTPGPIDAGGGVLIENLPCISDVMASLQILSELGASIRMVSRSTYEIDTSHLDSTEVSNELSRQMRASYYFSAHCWAALAPVKLPCRAAAIWPAPD